MTCSQHVEFAPVIGFLGRNYHYKLAGRPNLGYKRRIIEQEKGRVSRYIITALLIEWSECVATNHEIVGSIPTLMGIYF